MFKKFLLIGVFFLTSCGGGSNGGGIIDDGNTNFSLRYSILLFAVLAYSASYATSTRRERRRSRPRSGAAG